LLRLRFEGLEPIELRVSVAR